MEFFLPKVQDPFPLSLIAVNGEGIFLLAGDGRGIRKKVGGKHGIDVGLADELGMVGREMSDSILQVGHGSSVVSIKASRQDRKRRSKPRLSYERRCTRQASLQAASRTRSVASESLPDLPPELFE